MHLDNLFKKTKKKKQKNDFSIFSPLKIPGKKKKDNDKDEIKWKANVYI